MAILNIRVKSWFQQKQRRPGCVWNCIVITGFTNYEDIFATPGWGLIAHWYKNTHIKTNSTKNHKCMLLVNQTQS